MPMVTRYEVRAHGKKVEDEIVDIDEAVEIALACDGSVETYRRFDEIGDFPKPPYKILQAAE